MIRMYEEIKDYYTRKFIEHGPTPLGVDWKNKESQFIRYHQLTKIIGDDKGYSLNDIGCGYGGLLEVLNNTFKLYRGYDLSTELIKHAKQKFKNPKINFIEVQHISEIEFADYCIASGIFNVKLNVPDNEWIIEIIKSIEKLNSSCKKGFSFNMLTSYSDKDLMKDNLFYGDPLYFFDYCKKNFSANVALLHDYNLFDFTILVRK